MHLCRRRATPLLIKTDVSCVSFSTMSVWTCLSWFSPTLPSNSWALGALFLCHTGIGSLPSLSFYWAHVIYYIMQRSSLTGRKMETMLAVLFSAGRLLYLKLHSTLYWRILYSTGGTGHCTPNGYTSMSTASTTSTTSMIYLYSMHSSFLNRSSRSSMMIDTYSNSVPQICYTLWVNFWIRPPCWDFVPGIRHSCWSCSYWPSFVDPVALGGVEGIGDSWSSQRLPLPMEPLKFPATVWRVSNYY